MVMTIEAPVRPGSLEELMVQDSRWNDAGLTPEDLAEWLPPGLPAAIACDALDAVEFDPAG
jgi:hypothetical protein